MPLSLDEIEVRWPSGLVERFTDIDVNADVTLEEGTGVATSTGDPSLPSGLDGLQFGRPYPNPAVNAVWIPVAGGAPMGAELEIMNTLGQTVAHRRLDDGQGLQEVVRLDLADLPGGTYFLTVGGRPVRAVVVAK